MKKKILTSLIIMMLFPIYKIYAQSDKLNEGIIKIVKAFDSKNSDLINKYIYPDYGLIVIFRNGMIDEYKKIDKFDFKKPVPEYLPYSSFKTDFKIKFQALPTFDCDSRKWSKTGLYCDKTKKDNKLSQTATTLNNFVEEQIPEKTIEKFKEIEKKSHRVVLVDNNRGELIFYITRIKNKWYLTILDRVSSDCDL